MKHDEDTELAGAILAAAAIVDVELSAEQSRAMLAHLRLALRRSISLSLVGPVSERDAVTRHVIDSLTVLPQIADTCGRIGDIGAGAGFPGIPIAIATGRETWLIESVGKKARFLEEAVLTSGAPCVVRNVRSEQVARTNGGEFAVVVVRAVATLPVLVELAAPLLARGGRLVAMKGRPSEDELERGDAAAALCGMRLLQAVPAEVPGLHASRTLVVYEREGQPRVSLPRRNGLAGKRPLA